MRLLREMLEIPSETGATQEFGTFLLNEFLELGFDAEIEAGNLIVRNGNPKFLILTHLDTVPGELQIREEKGKIYGRGACDTKASWASLLQSLTGKEELMIIGSMDEEVASHGIRQMVAHARGIQGAVVMEPTRLRLCNSQRGFMALRVFGRGEEGHSFQPSKSQNAIMRLLVSLKAIERMHKKHNKLGREQFTVTRIEGGSAGNVIPRQCEALVDCRLVESSERTLKRIPKKLRYTVSGILEPFSIKKSEPIVRLLNRAIRKTLGRCEISCFPAASEASILYTHKIPSVVFGPGDLRFAHTEEEHVRFSEVEKAKKILKNFWKLI